MLYEENTMEPWESCEIVSSTQSNNTVSHPSGSAQHGPEHYKDVDEEPQLKALMKRLTILEEPLFIIDQPINYCLRYSNEETAEDADKLNPYCAEETHCNFPTDESLSDLLTLDNCTTLKAKNGQSSTQSLAIDNSIVYVPIPNQNKQETEGGEGIMFETPLMYSRCSSLDSLSSCEPLNDGSSVISEFSQVTSGLVSPSELPDSPTLTMPNSVDPFVVTSDNTFKDQVSEFRREGIPIKHFKVNNPNKFSFNKDQLESMTKDKHQLLNQSGSCPTIEMTLIDEEEDILTACINDGIQSSLYKYQKSVVTKNTRNVCCVPTQQASEMFLDIEIPVKSDKNSKIPYLEEMGDSVTIYQTEGTPFNISHPTSHTDSTNICLLSDNSDCNNTLNDCIRSGMPQI